MEPELYEACTILASKAVPRRPYLHTSTTAGIAFSQSNILFTPTPNDMVAEACNRDGKLVMTASPVFRGTGA